jgi:predicted RNA-binding protein with PUA-like domain
MIHIAALSACLGLMAGANRILPSGGILYLYGPFKRDGQHTAPSNEAFDATLRNQNPEWGVRDLNDVVEMARERDLSLLATYQMPANNLSVVFQRQ